MAGLNIKGTKINQGYIKTINPLDKNTVGFVDALYGPYHNTTEAFETIVDMLGAASVIPKGLTIGVIESGKMVEYWLPGDPAGTTYQESDLVLKISSQGATTLASDDTNGLMSSADYKLLQSLKKQSLSFLSFRGNTEVLPPVFSRKESDDSSVTANKVGFAYRYSKSESGELPVANSASGSKETVAFGDLLVCVTEAVDAVLYTAEDEEADATHVAGTVKTAAVDEQFIVVNANLDDDYFKVVMSKITVSGTDAVFTATSGNTVTTTQIADAVENGSTSWYDVTSIEEVTINTSSIADPAEGSDTTTVTISEENLNDDSEFVLTVEGEGTKYISLITKNHTTALPVYNATDKALAEIKAGSWYITVNAAGDHFIAQDASTVEGLSDF